MDHVITLVLAHDLEFRVVHLRQTAPVGIGLHDARENDPLARPEHLFHERLIIPRTHEHPGLVRDHQFEDLHALPPGLDHVGGDDFAGHRLKRSDR